MASTVAFQSAPEVIFHPIATVNQDIVGKVLKSSKCKRFICDNPTKYELVTSFQSWPTQGGRPTWRSIENVRLTRPPMLRAMEILVAAQQTENGRFCANDLPSPGLKYFLHLTTNLSYFLHNQIRNGKSLQTYAPINRMPQGTPIPPPPPGRWWGFDQGGGQMYPKSPPGDRRNGQTAPPWYTRRSQCRLASVNVTRAVTHLVVKFPTPRQSKSVKSRGLPGRGGGYPRACN